MSTALAILTNLADKLRTSPPECDEASATLCKCNELVDILRAAAAPKPKRAAAAFVVKQEEDVTLTGLPRELLARIVAVLPTTADVCRVGRASKAFCDVPPAMRQTSVLEDGLRLRAWARAERAAERAAAAALAVEALRVELREETDEAKRAAITSAAETTAREAETEAHTAQVERSAAAAAAAALPAGVSSWAQRCLVREERRDAVARPLRIAAAEYHSAFVDSAGRLLTCGRGMGCCWLLGQGPGVRRSTTPAPVVGLDGICITSVSATTHTLAVSAEGAVYSFGDGESGELGHGDHDPQYFPRLIEALRGVRVRVVAAGFEFSLALADTGSVYSWGAGELGELGHGRSEVLHTPRKIEALSGTCIWAVAAGHAHCLAICEAGRAYSWGDGDTGKLGHGCETGELTPRPIDALKDVRVTAVAAGCEHSLAVVRGGKLFSWGHGADGQLGHGKLHIQPTPKLVEALGDVKICHAAAGAIQSLAVSEAGDVFSWGGRTAIQRSLDAGHDGYALERDEPRPVIGLDGVAVDTVAVGIDDYLAVSTSGAVYCWGSRHNLPAAERSDKRRPFGRLDYAWTASWAKRWMKRFTAS